MTQTSDFLLPPRLADLARRAIEENRAAGRKIAVAESCTGGLVAAALTEIAGSSDVFESGFVTYSNEAKMELLGVSRDVIETFGSVSVAAAWAMAQGAIKRTGADVAVAITGIAGPSGGSEMKPVGTVVFAGPSAAATPPGSSPTARSSATSGGPACAFRRRSARSSSCFPTPFRKGRGRGPRTPRSSALARDRTSVRPGSRRSGS